MDGMLLVSIRWFLDVYISKSRGVRQEYLVAGGPPNPMNTDPI